MHKDREKYAGFTLVELLVVISIIALLLAILMPSLQRARWQSQMITCRANFRQIGIVYQMYVMDYGGSLIPAVTSMNPIVTWAETLADYVRINASRVADGGGTIAARSNILRCPSNDNRSKDESAYSYSAGCALSGDNVGTLPLRIDRIKRRLSEIALHWDSGLARGPAQAAPDGSGSYSLYNWHMRSNNKGSANFLMVDGGVRNYKDPSYDTPMRDRNTASWLWGDRSTKTITRPIWFRWIDRR